MIIGFAGRMRSGKSELANVCVDKYGYIKLSFATPLKELCADLLNVSVDELNRMKNDKTEISLNLGTEDVKKFLVDNTNIQSEMVNRECDGITVKSVRELLQFIGTDLIRRYNADWHVNKLVTMVDKDKNYVFDDVRFPNEKNMIESLGGDCWFVVRPLLDKNISNHDSEVSLTWHDFENKVIINDDTLWYLQYRWEIFMDNYKISMEKRDKELEDLSQSQDINGRVGFSTIADMLMIHKCYFSYAAKDLHKITEMELDPQSALVFYENGASERITNPLALEDLKILINAD